MFCDMGEAALHSGQHPCALTQLPWVQITAPQFLVQKKNTNVAVLFDRTLLIQWRVLTKGKLVLQKKFLLNGLDKI